MSLYPIIHQIEEAPFTDEKPYGQYTRDANGRTSDYTGMTAAEVIAYVEALPDSATVYFEEIAGKDAILEYFEDIIR